MTDIVDGLLQAAGPSCAAIKPVIYDPDPLSLAGLTAIIQGTNNIRVAGGFCSRAEFVSGVAAQSANTALMCIDNLSVQEVEEAVAELVAACSRRPVGIAVISMSVMASAQLAALKAGARGVLLKSYPPRRLIREIVTVAEGGTVLPTELMAALLDLPTLRTAYPSSGALSEPTCHGLTPRQREILTLVAHGLSNFEIADSLQISNSTVKSHVSAMLQRLELRNRTQLVVYAHGLR